MESRQLHRNNVQFDYFSENFIRFEEDFYTYSNMNIPLTFITDDILLSMSESQVNFFNLPAFKAKDKRNHYYVFKVMTQANNKQLRTYEYIRHTLSIY